MFSERIRAEKKSEKLGWGITLTAGNFDKALEQWNDLYNTGYRSAELEYNIGNAYFKLNNIPAANLSMNGRISWNLADEDIIYNLQITRTMVVGGLKGCLNCFL